VTLDPQGLLDDLKQSDAFVFGKVKGGGHGINRGSYLRSIATHNTQIAGQRP
jgi:hypothetical protein